MNRIRDRRNAEELDALLDGRLPADDAGREVRRLATLATTVVEERPGPHAALDDDARHAIRDRLMADIAELEAPVGERVATGARMRRAANSARAALASALASTLIAGTGMAVAAQEALPGDFLYGLKKGTETVRMSLASDATQAARLELRFAEERLEEVVAGADRLDSDRLIEALTEMDRRSLVGSEQLVLIAEREGEPELLAEVDDFVERQSEGLVTVFARLPIEVRPYAEDSLATLRRIRAHLLLPAIDACDCPEVITASHTTGTEAQRMTSDPLPEGAREEATSSSSGGSGDGDGDTDGDLREPLRDIASDSGGSTDSGGVLRDTTRTVEGTVESTTDAVEGTTETVEGTVESTTDTVEDTANDTTETVVDVLDLLDSTTSGTLGR